MIEAIEDIQGLVRQGLDDWKQHGEVSVKRYGDLLQFNYTPAAQFEGRWNYFETVSRGLIIHAETGEVIARPFDKFFNYGEGGRYPAAYSHIHNACEKMDGSLGILYWYDGKWQVATRGSLESDQAQWATEFLDRDDFNQSVLDRDWTPLVEIIYPGNRVVVDYGPRQELVLLAMRSRHTGVYASWSNVRDMAFRVGFGLPKRYNFMDLEGLLKAKSQLTVNEEGWVVEFSDGSRFKIKGDAYLEMHKLISSLSFKNTLEAIVNGTVDELRARIPDEFLGQVNIWCEEINDTVGSILHECDCAFGGCPKDTRKEFAMYVLEHHKSLAPYLFAMLDGKDVESMIYKIAFSGKEVNG